MPCLPGASSVLKRSPSFACLVRVSGAWRKTQHYTRKSSCQAQCDWSIPSCQASRASRRIERLSKLFVRDRKTLFDGILSEMGRSTRQVLDQMGRRVAVPQRPSRIVSLVPSQTELLFDLGLDKEIVGLTSYCVHPAEATGRKTRVGGTKKFCFDAIDRLRPDLILGNKEENYRAGIRKRQRSLSRSDTRNCSGCRLGRHPIVLGALSFSRKASQGYCSAVSRCGRAFGRWRDVLLARQPLAVRCRLLPATAGQDPIPSVRAI